MRIYLGIYLLGYLSRDLMGIYIYIGMQWGYAGGFVGFRPTILLYCQSINAQVMAIKWKIKYMGLN